MPIEDDLQALLAAAPNATGQMLIDPALVRAAAAETTRLRTDLERVSRELAEQRETIPASATARVRV